MTKNSLSHRLHHNGLLLAVAAVSAGAAIVTAACSSGSGGAGPGFQNNPDSSTSGGDGGVGPAGSCANPTVGIVFSPMYSAYIPGSTAQVFAIPAITADGNTATWSLSDPTQATLQNQMFMNGSDMLPGVMITLAGTGDSNGDVTVFATESGGACGSAVLHVTTNAETDWTIGSQRYNDGVSLHLPGNGGGDGGRPEGGLGHHDGGGGGGGGGFGGADSGSYFESDGGTACTNCHGPMATNGVYNDVSHTPEQTGGFSDTDLAGIILDGVIPDGGYFDPTVILPNCDGGAGCTQMAYERWHSFHQWTDIQSDQLPGIICYLRSLTPAPQNGMSNFGGGGGHHHDGGFGPPPGDGSAAGD